MKINVLVFLLTFSYSRAQQSSHPSVIDPTLKDQWCKASINTCETICRGRSTVPAVAQCSALNLLENCLCTDGFAPVLDNYENTVSYFICEHDRPSGPCTNTCYLNTLDCIKLNNNGIDGKVAAKTVAGKGGGPAGGAAPGGGGGGPAGGAAPGGGGGGPAGGATPGGGGGGPAGGATPGGGGGGPAGGATPGGGGGGPAGGATPGGVGGGPAGGATPGGGGGGPAGGATPGGGGGGPAGGAAPGGGGGEPPVPGGKVPGGGAPGPGVSANGPSTPTNGGNIPQGKGPTNGGNIPPDAPKNSDNSSSNSKNVSIAIGISASLLSVIMAVTLIIWYRRRRNKTQSGHFFNIFTRNIGNSGNSSEEEKRISTLKAGLVKGEAKTNSSGNYSSDALNLPTADSSKNELNFLNRNSDGQGILITKTHSISIHQDSDYFGINSFTSIATKSDNSMENLTGVKGVGSSNESGYLANSSSNLNTSSEDDNRITL